MGADKTIQDDEGKTPLDLAREERLVYIVKLLEDN
jgi:hypothetical protein